MRKNITKLLNLILILLLTFSFILPIKTSAETTPINYVALGDSIATGTVINGAKIDSYVKYFGDFLKKSYPNRTVSVNNLSHDGDRSTELLALLTGTTTSAQNVQNAVKTANIITISIGGNNLMKAAKIPGFSSIDGIKAKQGVDAFTLEWPQIIQTIKSLNSTAQIIVNTQYNPFNTISSTLYKNDAALHTLLDTYLITINNLIINNASSGYKVADVHSELHPFALKGQMGSYTYFYPLLSILRNPHPNYNGQQKITGVIKSVFSPIP